MADITDEQAFEIYWLWEHGVSRQEIAERIGYSAQRIFDRNVERRGKGRPLHPLLTKLPRHQGRGGGRRPGKAWKGRDPSPQEIALRCAEVLARRELGGE